MNVYRCLIALVIVTGCARELRRTPGEDCSAVTIVFREARGGVGPEFSHLADASEYVTCPTAGASVPPALEQSWETANQNVFVFSSAAVEKVPDAKPIAAKVMTTWTHPQDGVLYKYAQYIFIFHACDFWYSPTANTKCALPAGAAPPPAASAARS